MIVMTSLSRVLVDVFKGGYVALDRLFQGLDSFR